MTRATTLECEATDDEVARFEAAVSALLDEGYSILDYRGLLSAAAERAGVDLQKVLPTRH